MKRVIFGLIATVFMSVSSVNAQTPSNEEVYRYLQLKYDFEKIEFNVNESKNDLLLNSIKNSTFISANVSLEELNLSNVTKVYHKDGFKSLVVPYAKNSKYNLVISIAGNNYGNLLRTVILKNDIDTKGNGTISLSTPSETFSDKFVDGKKETTSTKKGCFRKCLDQAYDDICDGVIGCLAWYTNVLVPVTAITYCGFKC